MSVGLFSPRLLVLQIISMPNSPTYEGLHNVSLTIWTMEIMKIIFKNSRCVSITKTKWLMLFREILLLVLIIVRKKRKAIPVTGRVVPYGFETSRLPHFLDNRLTDGGKFVSLTRRAPFTTRKIPGAHFC
jgi:hypothetical protein